MNLKRQKRTGGVAEKILSCGIGYVKPGGKLLYSTCTIHREENEENVQKFLENIRI